MDSKGKLILRVSILTPQLWLSSRISIKTKYQS